MNGTAMITLTAGTAVLEIAPAAGGAVAGWHRAGQPIFRTISAEARAEGQARSQASYPLVPFSNRIAGRRFAWGGEVFNLPEQFGGFAIHGAGWLHPWTVAETTASTALITLDLPPTPEWPFAFRTWQRLALTPDGLDHSIGLTNTDTRSFPAGIGQHPFFPRGPRTRLRFEADRIWHNGMPGQIPTHATKVEGAYDHSEGQAVGPVFLDNCFGGFAGTAQIDNPDFGHRLHIAADAVFGHCIVYIPTGQPHFAFEPVSNMNDGINRMDQDVDHGMFVLQPGESREGRIAYRVEDLA